MDNLRHRPEDASPISIANPSLPVRHGHRMIAGHQRAAGVVHLGCSEKSLSRATLEAADMSAKAFLVNRIVLEAKRLLAHTALPVATIGDRLGFAEATNFVKFFRRETGLPPGAFRARQARGQT